MSLPATQAEAGSFLAGLAGKGPLETHISAVFRGRHTVWKMKKAVRLSYLDFSTLAARERFLHRELELNRPAAPEIYGDVVAIRRRPDGRLALGGEEGEAIEWVLRMARVPEGDFLDAIAAREGISPLLADALGDAVYTYHCSRPKLFAVHSAKAMQGVAEGNTLAAAAVGFDPGLVEEWRERVSAELITRANWLDRRAAEGFVRRCHGDLHLGNLCLWHGRPVLFDALEFDEDLASIDVGYDLAFLLMDLDQEERPAAGRVLARYVARGGDAALVTGLVPWLSLRAMVRAHVLARRSRPQARVLLDRALAYLAPPPPVVVAVGGLPGVGKTTLARALAPGLGPTPGALVLRSDEIRKRLAGVAPEVRLDPRYYTPAWHARVETELAAMVAVAARGGQAVIADATFLEPRLRAAVAAAAGGVTFRSLWLTAPMAELERRVAERGTDASDATVAVLRAAAAKARAPEGWVELDASDAATVVEAAREALTEINMVFCSSGRQIFQA